MTEPDHKHPAACACERCLKAFNEWLETQQLMPRTFAPLYPVNNVLMDYIDGCLDLALFGPGGPEDETFYLKSPRVRLARAKLRREMQERMNDLAPPPPT